MQIAHNIRRSMMVIQLVALAAFTLISAQSLAFRSVGAARKYPLPIYGKSRPTPPQPPPPTPRAN